MPLDMNPVIRAQWCAALRSGDYRQTSGKLADHKGFCCLGVLSELGRRAGIVGARSRHPQGWYEYDGCSNWLPDSVADWGGIRNNPVVHLSSGRTELLAQVNDNGATFAEIADLIDGGAS